MIETDDGIASERVLRGLSSQDIERGRDQLGRRMEHAASTDVPGAESMLFEECRQADLLYVSPATFACFT